MNEEKAEGAEIGPIEFAKCPQPTDLPNARAVRATLALNKELDVRFRH